MAIRGRKPRPEFLRYYDAGVEPSIYVLEAGPIVKVGRANRAARRLKQLHTEFLRAGLEIGRFTAFPQEGGWMDLYRAEFECIRALAAVAENTANSREYFTGIDYETAVQIVRDALAA